jgi:hypothetical protein
VRIVHVERRLCILSTGEPLLIRFEKLFHLCEQLQQDEAEVTVRTWPTKDGSEFVTELIEIHRVSSAPPAEPEKSDGIF